MPSPREHATDKVHLLFNNAGIGGGGSLFANSRAQWEKTFNICWGGVYLCTRAFLPMLVKADAAHIVNTSSVNGFWASLGSGVPHTAYCAAKFAVKGFTEALITDLRVNAPHIKCSVVMPGHIGTSIVSNSRKIQFDTDSDAMGPEEIAQTRARLSAAGRDVSQVSDADIQSFVAERARQFRDEAPMTAAAAATVILDGVKAGRWRILVGDDAHQLDERVRRAPEAGLRHRILRGLRRHGRLARRAVRQMGSVAMRLGVHLDGRRAFRRSCGWSMHLDEGPLIRPFGAPSPQGEKGIRGVLVFNIGPALRPLSPSGRGREAMTYGRELFANRDQCPRWRGRKSFGRTGEGKLVPLSARSRRGI